MNINSKSEDGSAIDLNEFANAMRNESDRACAVLGGSLLDFKLEEAFKRRIIVDKKLFEFNGPLGTFSSRILLAKSLGMIEDGVRTDLDCIRKIRNEFAHNISHDYSFNEERVKSLCSSLIVIQSYLSGYEESLRLSGKNVANDVVESIRDMFSKHRWRFELAVTFIAQHLDKIPQKDIKLISSKNLNEEVKELSRSMFIRNSLDNEMK